MDAHALWRTRWVCENLSGRGYVADYAVFDSIDAVEGLIQAGRYNLVVTPRLIFTNAAEMVPFFRERTRLDNMRWVYELDDQIVGPEIIDHQLACFEICREAGRDHLEYERQQRLITIGAADAVIASTPRLAATVRTYTDTPVYQVPNAIDMPWMAHQMRDLERRLPHPTIGWAGGARRELDLDAVAEAWRRIAARRTDVTFVVFGERMPNLMDAIPKGQHRRVYIPWTDLEVFPRGLKEIDIACCNVDDTDWNNCKSPDKYLEHTVAGSPCVVSPALYGSVVTDGYDALVAKTADEWEASLERLLDDATLRQDLVSHALLTVARNHSMQQTWQRWVEVLSSILAQSNVPFSKETVQSHAEPDLVLARNL